MKRLLDCAGALLGLVLVAPLLGVAALAIWAQDGHSPFYRSRRAARGGKCFTMLKLRSMCAQADRTGVNSTSEDDPRITAIGRVIRAYKLDELAQLWNVLIGDMSLVGPRPQVFADAERYTDVEKRMLTVRPGITDLSSIVFADEGEILRGRPDPDAAYDRTIRPWKSRLALLYVEKRSLAADVEIILLTLLGLFSRSLALHGVERILRRWSAPPLLIRMASRREPLLAYPPPGAAGAAAAQRS